MTASTLLPAVSPPASSLGDILKTLRGAVRQIQAHASTFDAEGAFPQLDLDLLATLGVLDVFASDLPSPLELMQALRLVGSANLSVGRIFEGHVNGARLINWYGDEQQKRDLEDQLRVGRIFGVWNTEPSPGVRLIRSDGRQTLSGRKSYATGAGHIDRAIITAVCETGERQMLIVEADDPARADPGAWRVRGMRATVSGTYDLTGMKVDPGMVLGRPDAYELEPRFSGGAWRFTAVQLGGVERVLVLLRAHIIECGSSADPIHRARFGRALAATRSAGLWVREACVRAEASDADADAIAFVLMTRGVVEQAGLEVMEAAARSVGTRAFFTDHPLDQACRDLALYLRQPAPDQALDRAAQAFLDHDCWRGDELW